MQFCKIILFNVIHAIDVKQSVSVVDKSECSSSPCQNGGKCVELISGYYCSCATGYNGDRCEIGICTS